MEGIECAGFTFYNKFDSANLGKVAHVPQNESTVTLGSSVSGNKPVPEIPDAEFNVWTRPDCYGTEFENGNRTWFHFGVKAPQPSMLLRFNLVDLNRQGKMYSQGMAPVYRTVPGKPQWERVRDKPIHNTTDDVFTLSFKFKASENVNCVTYFAFTYPYSYSDLQKMLTNIDLKFKGCVVSSDDDIYYAKEVVCRTLDGRDVNLLTVSSHHGISTQRETRLASLFPENKLRPFKFTGKKLIFVSARVHPGETPSSFVFNGFLNLLLSRDDPVAQALRRHYVFKMIPMLNPDGVALGHYRTDTRGVNLNRVYLNPVLALHPTVYAARAILRYCHHGEEREDEEPKDSSISDTNISSQVSHMSIQEDTGEVGSTAWCKKCKSMLRQLDGIIADITKHTSSKETVCKDCDLESSKRVRGRADRGDLNANDSGLFLYMDMHGHASKKGIFMYGNHFEDVESNVECMLLPKLMSINNHNFQFTACNFTERNMYLRDRRDGMSREGSGRVAVLKMTGLTRSYTLECNYNTGRVVNVLPSTIKEGNHKVHTLSVPPKYTPQVFEEVGRSLGASILDLTGQNPSTRVPNSEFHTLSGLREWLCMNCTGELDEPRITHLSKPKVRHLPHTNQGVKAKRRPSTAPVESTVTPDTAAKPAFRPVRTKTKKKEPLKKRAKGVAPKVKTEQERKKLLRDICYAAKGESASASSGAVSSDSWRATAALKRPKSDVEAGPSRLLAQSFAKSSAFPKCKFKKHLRRLTSATETGKIEKAKKRKKVKAK